MVNSIADDEEVFSSVVVEVSGQWPSSVDLSVAVTDTMSNCTCFLVFFCAIPLHGPPASVTGDIAESAIGVRDLTGLKSSVVSDTGFFSMDLISDADTNVMAPVVNECDRLVKPGWPLPVVVVPGGLHLRRGGLTGD